ncbi:MAG: DUF4382 domain-containing protein [Aquificae bacterium]|nr:DUF4382 domain-containing protein [Aquificota bacterium]
MKGKKALLASALFISSIVAYNCGGGGGGGDATATTGTTTATVPLSVYVTDAPVDPTKDISVLETTVYEVYLCESVDPNAGCVNPVQVFSDANGVTVDLTNLEDVLHFIDTSQVPEGTYGGLMVVVSKTGTVVYQGLPGTYTIDPIYQDPTVTRVDCTDDRCSIIVTGSIQPAINNKLAVDFDLKNFSIDCSSDGQQSSCTVQKLVVVANPVTDPAVYKRFEMYGVVDPKSVSGDTFTVEWKGLQFKAQVTAQTRCEFNYRYYGGQGEYYTKGADCATTLQNKFQNQVCLELYVLGDPSNPDQTLEVLRFETKEPKKCGLTTSSYVSSDDYYYSVEVKAYVDAVNPETNTFTMSVGQEPYSINFTVEVNDATYCEFDYVDEEFYVYGTDCINFVSPGMLVEVKGYVELDKSNLPSEVYLVATKVEQEDYYEDDEYNSNYNDNANDNYEDDENSNS